MEWIRVLKELPPRNESIIVLTDSQSIVIAQLKDSGIFSSTHCCECDVNNVTHWKPLSLISEDK